MSYPDVHTMSMSPQLAAAIYDAIFCSGGVAVDEDYRPIQNV